MKVGVVVLGFNDVDRVEGTILHVQEFPDDKPVWFGRKVKPPRFQIIVLNNTRLADLPAGFREYGYHRSRKMLDYAKLANGMATQLRTKTSVGMDALSFRLACKDMGDYWQPDTVTRTPGSTPF